VFIHWGVAVVFVDAVPLALTPVLFVVTVVFVAGGGMGLGVSSPSIPVQGIHYLGVGFQV